MYRDQNESIQEFERWVKHTAGNAEINKELADMADNPEAIMEAFYMNLSFGTGGLRGYLGAGTNRMNIYTVSKASLGLAHYIIKNYPEGKRAVSIGYDSRINSKVFAETSAKVFASLGIQTFIFSELSPTPLLSWAVRRLKCSAGIMITASHNPAEYNGYKVYASDGCQITTHAAQEILAEIEMADFFENTFLPESDTDFQEGIQTGIISFIDGNIIAEYIEEVKKQSLLPENRAEINRNLSIIYTPLNGTGLKPVLRTLNECGFQDITVVEEQRYPDGHFPTCPRPNPELKEAMALGIQYAENANADIVIATDPDCDRMGIVVRNAAGQYIQLSGNETGTLLLDFICMQRKRTGNFPDNPVFIKTVVTTGLAEQIANSNGLKTINVPTGFKFIGEQIGLLEKANRKEDFIFAFEESYGYLAGTYVRDKDGVVAAMLICEMAAYYKNLGKNLLEILDDIYLKYGFYLDTLHTYQFEGIKGKNHMDHVMDSLRKLGVGLSEVGKDGSDGNKRLLAVTDYLSGNSYYADGHVEKVDGIPATNMLNLKLEDGCSVVIRPSGTEPKLKIYTSVRAGNREMAESVEKDVMEDFVQRIQKQKESK